MSWVCFYLVINMNNNKKELKLFIVAGEASGDQIGASIVRGIRRKYPGKVNIVGIGGSRLLEEGLESIIPMKNLSIMGLMEIIPSIPKILFYIEKTAKKVLKTQPDVLITIDSPGFNFRLCKKVHSKKPNFPLIHVVAPTVWAWKKYRAKSISKILDHLLVLLPIEPKYFIKEGLKTTFVGHPVIEEIRNESVYNKNSNILKSTKNKSPIVSIMLGSRISEINNHIQLFIKTVLILRKKFPNLLLLTFTLPHLEEVIKPYLTKLNIPFLISSNIKDRDDFYRISNVALAVSGTVTLELAMANVPMIVVYKTSRLTFYILKKIVNVKYISIINILNDMEIVPEYIQNNAKPTTLALALEKLILDKNKANFQIKEFEKIRNNLKSKNKLPSYRLSEEILNTIDINN